MVRTKQTARIPAYGPAPQKVSAIPMSQRERDKQYQVAANAWMQHTRGIVPENDHDDKKRAALMEKFKQSLKDKPVKVPKWDPLYSKLLDTIDHTLDQVREMPGADQKMIDKISALYSELSDQTYKQVWIDLRNRRNEFCTQYIREFCHDHGIVIDHLSYVDYMHGRIMTILETKAKELDKEPVYKRFEEEFDKLRRQLIVYCQNPEKLPR